MNARIRSAARWIVGAVLVVSGTAAVMPAATALPSGDPYGDIEPTSPTTYPRPDLTITVRWEGVTHWETGAWLGSKAILTVKNGGTKGAGAFTVAARGKEVDELGNTAYRSLTHNVSGLAAGRSISIESLYFRRYCSVDFWAMADSAKAVSESIEGNNSVYADLQRCGWD